MRIFLDPWDSEYTAFFQVEEEQKADKIDVNVEIHKDNWIPILEKKRVVEDSVIFIDGVRSMHQRIVVEENGKIFYGGFGTYVAGALKLERGKRNIISTALIEISLKRVLFLPKGINIEKKELYIPGIPFKVKVEFIEENEPNASLKKIQELMRTEEVRLADKVSQDYGGIPTVVDGTLYFPWKHANVVGFVKSLHTLYLPDDLIHIVLRLRKGERTPLFLIMFKDGELLLKNLFIAEYKYGNQHNHETRRDRKLLLRKPELRKLEKKVKEKGFSIIPYRVYISERGFAKVEIVLGQGKKSYDKRETIKQRDNKRELDRIKKQYR